MDASPPQPQSPSAGVPNDGLGDDADIPLAVPALDDAPPTAQPPPPPKPLTYEKPAGGLGLEPYVLEGSAWRHVFLPLALVCLGTAMLYAGAVWRVGLSDELPRVVSRYSLDAGISLAASLAACAACAQVLDVTLGLLVPAVAKLAAVVVLPMGAASLIAAALGGEGGAVALGFVLSVPVMWFLFLWLFNSMDGREAIICCNAITVVRMVSILIARPF